MSPSPPTSMGLAGALALATLLACTPPPPLVPHPVPAAGYSDLDAETRAAADEPCGSCHKRSLPSAKPAALAVFDLEEANWPARMSPAQLHEFLARLDRHLDEGTRPRVRAFLEAEVARRTPSE